MSILTVLDHVRWQPLRLERGVEMEELLENCRKLCSGNFLERARAYHRLRSSRAFALVSYEMRGLRLTCYGVARLLADDAPDALSISARRLLEAQFVEQDSPR